MPRGRGGGRGASRRGGGGHKGQRRHFTNEEDIKQAEIKKEKDREWRRQQGLPSESEGSGSEDEDDRKPAAAAAPRAPADPKAPRTVQPGDLPPSSSDEYSSEDEDAKPKGIAHLIEVQNPNHMKKKENRKVTDLGDDDTKPTLSRREREEIEKQAAAERYKKLHLAGKTDEARADLARLQIIKKQREDAALRKEQERQAKEIASAERKVKGRPSSQSDTK